MADNLKDGEIFHSITLGFGSMGAHGSQIRTEDRWKLVLYIRRLQAEAEGNLSLLIMMEIVSISNRVIDKTFLQLK